MFIKSQLHAYELSSYSYCKGSQHTWKSENENKSKILVYDRQCLCNFHRQRDSLGQAYFFISIIFKKKTKTLYTVSQEEGNKLHAKQLG